ncbi:MAG: hypothetical protein JWM63_4952 [Gammaproteobacteria bacterium]|jgi:uncharacterized membrane protein YkoI|nr:hypothetical protein [Gammaproteobacteria bacterium]
MAGCYRGGMGVLRASIPTAVILALLAVIGSGARATAAGDRAGDFVLATAGISMDQAVKMAEQQFKARVVRAETQREGDRTIYILKLLNDAGRVWTVRVDAASGAIL